MSNARIGIIGLGRVGRGILRANYGHSQQTQYNLCAICDVMPVDQIAYLLQNDSTYGRAPFTLECDGQELFIAGEKVTYIRGDRRRNILDHACFAELKQLRLDILIDATGTAHINDLRALISNGIAQKVICTSNIAGIDISIVYGINHQNYDASTHHIIAASTCTGNAMTPIAYILDKHFGLEYARITTIHPVLSDQRVLDGYHATAQLGRTCVTSIMPISTNVAKSTELVLPQLVGKLDSISYRVPTSIVSVMDVTARLERPTTQSECAELMMHYAQHELQGILHCESGSWGHEKASIDYLGTEYSCIVLMKHLKLSGKHFLGISLMHDNEHAYCCRVLDIIGTIQSNMLSTS